MTRSRNIKPGRQYLGDVVAEKATLGSVLLCDGERDKALLATTFRSLSASDFADSNHAEIYRHLRALFRQGAIDPLLLANRLREVGAYEKIGGAATLAEIGLSVPTSAHLSFYAAIVTKASMKRQAILLATDSLAKLKNCDNPTTVLAELRSGIDDLAQDSQRETHSTGEMFEKWAAAITNREKPQLFECAAPGSDLGKFPMGPEQVTMIGAPPAAGKTALVGQVVFDALRVEEQESLRLLIANVEMSPQALWTRQLARSSGVSYSYLHHRDYDESARERIESALDELRSLMPRLEFMAPPFTLQHLQHRAESMAADIVLVDYAQRFSSENKISDSRAMTNLTMDTCRHLANQGRAVIVVSALSRQKGSGGSTYDSKSQGLASFRESSELEYGADSAWLLVREPDRDSCELRCVKNRTGSLQTITLLFDGARQEFRDNPSAVEWKP